MLRCGELMILPRVSRMLRDESTDLSPFFSAAAPTAPDASSSAFIPLMLSVCGSKRSLCQGVSCAWLAASWLLTNSLTLALGSSARAASFCIDSVSSAARPTQDGQHATDGSTAKVRGKGTRSRDTSGTVVYGQYGYLHCSPRPSRSLPGPWCRAPWPLSSSVPPPVQENKTDHKLFTQTGCAGREAMAGAREP